MEYLIISWFIAGAIGFILLLNAMTDGERFPWTNGDICFLIFMSFLGYVSLFIGGMFFILIKLTVIISDSEWFNREL